VREGEGEQVYVCECVCVCVCVCVRACVRVYVCVRVRMRALSLFLTDGETFQSKISVQRESTRACSLARTQGEGKRGKCHGGKARKRKSIKKKRALVRITQKIRESVEGGGRRGEREKRREEKGGEGDGGG